MRTSFHATSLRALRVQSCSVARARPLRGVLMRAVGTAVLAGGLTAFTPLAAQTPVTPPAQPAPEQPAVGPPIQRIETASALSTTPLGAVHSVFELADGRVLVNDGIRRRLLLMDTTLTEVEVVLDSLSDIANTYGTRPGALLPYHADSVLFVDPASFAMVVLDPQGRIARVRSVWRVEDVLYVTSTTGTYGSPGLDARGRMVYRIPARAAPPRVPPPAGVPYFPQQPDSAFIVAVDLSTRRQDTIAVVRTPKIEMRARQTAEGRFTIEQVVNPLPVTDNWGVLSDGTVAIVRASDYRVDYLEADGTWTSSPKLPYAWQRLTDEDKTRLVDSVRAVQQRNMDMNFVYEMIRWVNQYNRSYPINFRLPDGFTLPPGLPRDWLLPPGLTFPENYIYACPPGVTPPPPTAPPAGGPPQPSCYPYPVTLGGGTVPPPPSPRSFGIMRAEDLPDYRPPMPTAAVRADLDGNLWVRTIPPRPIPGGMVYDIISRSGELTTRLQLPPGYTLVGFGRDKVVYLSMRDPTGLRLARVRLR